MIKKEWWWMNQLNQNKMNDNKLIAEFMGYEVKHGKCYSPKYNDGTIAPMQFDRSWDWLMPVVEKIESLGYWVNRNDGDITISNKSDMVVITPMSSGGIDMMYKAVVEFIKEYNDGEQ